MFKIQNKIGPTTSVTGRFGHLYLGYYGLPFDFAQGGESFDFAQDRESIDVAQDRESIDVAQDREPVERPVERLVEPFVI